ncbi:hypothetical protein SDC9_183682 [bioreactor metagenome]|uniref:Uncharacterized protein n=1 Tax=bioreactor metagenome TaxID=1076179 RepID=A0A645HAW9_9ZZZZ
MTQVIAELFRERDGAQVKRVPAWVEAAIQRLQYQPRAADGCQPLPAILRLGVDFNLDSAVVDGVAARAGDELTVF